MLGHGRFEELARFAALQAALFCGEPCLIDEAYFRNNCDQIFVLRGKSHSSSKLDFGLIGMLCSA